MIVNSKTKQKPKTILGRIRNLVLDFVLYFVTTILFFTLLQFTTVTTPKNGQNYYNEKCAKYLTFDLKKYRGVIFHDTGRVMRNLKKN